MTDRRAQPAADLGRDGRWRPGPDTHPLEL